VTDVSKTTAKLNGSRNDDTPLAESAVDRSPSRAATTRAREANVTRSRRAIGEPASLD